MIAMLLNLLHHEEEKKGPAVRLDKQIDQVFSGTGAKQPAMAVGDSVTLSADYKKYSDAASGPLKTPSDVGTIVEKGSRLKVSFKGSNFWYDIAALKPARGQKSLGSPQKPVDVMEALDDLGVVVLRELKDLIDPKTGDFSDKLTPRTVYFIKAQGGATKNDVDGRVLREMLRPAVRSTIVPLGSTFGSADSSTAF